MTNPAALDLFGYVIDEIIGKPVSMLLPADFLSSKEVRANCEVQARRKDGTQFPVFASFSADADEDVGAVFVRNMEDIAAKLEDGILKIEVPKVVQTIAKKQIEIL